MGKKKKKKKIDWAVYLRLLSFVKPYKKRLILGIAFGFLAGGSIFGLLVNLGTVLDQIVGDNKPTKSSVLTVERQGEQVSIPVENVKNEEGEYEELFQVDDKVTEVAPVSAQKAATQEAQETVEKIPAPVRDFLTGTLKMELVNAKGEPAGAMLIIGGFFLLMFFLLKNAATYGNRYFMRWVGFRVVADMRSQLFAKLTNQSMEFHNSEDIGKMMSRCTNDTNIIHSAISQNIGRLTRAPIEILAVASFIGWFAVKNDMLSVLALLVLGVPACLLPIFVLGDKLKKYASKTLDKISLVMSRMQEALSCVRVVKAHNMEEFEQERFDNTNDTFFSTSMRSIKYELMMAPLTEFSAIFCSMIFAVYCYAKGVPFASLVALGVAAQQAYKPVKELTKVQANIIKSCAAAERIFEYLDLKYEIPDKQDAIDLPGFEKEITFNNVGFSYDGQKTLDDVTLTIPKGHFVAFVGEAGSGKTTIVNMLARFYDIHEGSIAIDGTDVRDISNKSLRKLIGFVDQVTTLFNESVDYNIAYGLDEADEKVIREAAARADVTGFIEKKDEGFDFNVGVKGIKLSGGQRQRVAIARAILKNPPILVLDEATSALDNVTEQIVQKAINELMGDRTVIAIAHRLSTVKDANCIYVMDHGRLAESGTHEELIAKGGKYATLWNTQFKEAQLMTEGIEAE